MTDVDGREASSYSATCPDCGCITARTGLKKHRGSKGCRGRQAENAAKARGLVMVSRNYRGIVEDAGLTFEFLDTDAVASSGGGLRARMWVERVTAAVLVATMLWDRGDRVVALAMTKYTMTPSFHTALAYCAETDDHAAIRTLLYANGNFAERLTA